MSSSRYPITKIQKFCTHDGDGIRTTVFFKGCPLSCLWCHNPETASNAPSFFYMENMCIGCMACVEVCKNSCHEIRNSQHIFDRKNCIDCGDCINICPAKALEKAVNYMTVDEIVREILSDKEFYGKTGGVTLSGGEPMMHGGAVKAILKKCKESGMTTAVETSGMFESESLKTIAPLVDEFLYDFKDGNDTRHIKNTGVSAKKIIENLYKLEKYDTKITLRCIMIANVNMDESNYNMIAKLFHACKNIKSVELLPYHNMGSSKYTLLSKDSPINFIAPTKKQLESASRFLSSLNVVIKR